MTGKSSDFKERIPREIELGKELFAYNRRSQSIFSKAFFKNLFLKVSMLDQKLQTQLFKFVDVLPSLKEEETVVNILAEYIDESSLSLGFLLRPFAKLPFVKGIFKATVEAAVSKLATTFICGRNVKEARQSIEKLQAQRQSYTLDLLGELAITQAEADEYYARYIELLKNIPQANISVKLSALVTQVNHNNFEEKKAILKDRLRSLYRLAQSHNATVNVDSEHYAWHELVFDVVKEVLAEPEFEDFSRAGIVIQAYLKESKADLEAWLTWAKKHKKRITVRLVKGAYWDYERAHALQKSWEVPVYEDKALSDINYEDLSELLLANVEYLRPAFASHNIRSLAKALRIAEEKNIDKKDFEIQMLYGMLSGLKSYFSERGYCLRVYLPYGELLPGMSYLVRRLLENTANDSFLRQSFVDKKDEEALLQNPQHAIKERQSLNESFQNSPDTDFNLQLKRSEFLERLMEVKANLGENKISSLLLAGKKEYSTESFPSYNPAQKEEVLASVFKADKSHCDSAIAGALDIQKSWSSLAVKKRAEVLTQTAQEFESKRFYLNSILVLESGKAWHEADAETSEAIDFLNYYADQALGLFSENKLRSLPGERNTNHYQALGLSLVISPWNFPLAIMLGMTVAALVTGNAVVVKPSSQTCLIAHEALSILLKNIEMVVGKKYRAVVSMLPGSGSVIGEYLIQHPAISSIAFTGSNKTGMRINEVAAQARPAKKIIAEMGGKNPIIVDKTADLDEAIPGVIYSAYGFSGQKCSACSRVIVEAEIYDEFKKRIVQSMAEINYADPISFEVYSGPVIDEAAYKNISSYIDIAKEDGDVLFYKESNLKDQGYFINPLLVENLKSNSRVSKEEIFGPVLALYKAENLDAAIHLANDTEYGLTAGLFSRSPKNIERVSREIEAGNFYINRPCTGAIVSRQAFGGHKNSSIGFKAGGPNYLLQFVLEKTITENTMRRGFTDD